MDITQVYHLLYSRIFYNLADDHRIRFAGQMLYIDRRAAIPFSLSEDNGSIYLEIPLYTRDMTVLRIQTDHPDGSPIHLYEKSSGAEVWVLN